MTQPLNRNCRISAKGEIDEQAGEFWVSNPFDLPAQRHNLSAYERNKIYINHSSGTHFVDLSSESGVDIDADSRSVVAADFNRDGAPDLLVGSVGGGPLRLFLNRIPQESNHLRVQLRGVTSNRSAIGCRVVAHVGDRRVVRDVFAANGFMGQAPADVTLGLGKAAEVDRLEVRWPNGETQSFAPVPSRGRVVITEGEEQLKWSE
ncbi:MAG: CRTAC1 family protein [Pirellulaceae bacterium]|nr:CRTAC1 family protein [Pirellulaceae bacterium]MDP7015921.1 CRTAC1 family protein [Pirellulaceae bacterium]